LLIKTKQQHGKNENKNTGLFINCMDFVVVRTKINKKLNRHFFVMLGALMHVKSTRMRVVAKTKLVAAGWCL
jgi:hypothetical protein